MSEWLKVVVSKTIVQDILYRGFESLSLRHDILFMRTTLAEITIAKHCIVARTEMILLQSEFDKLIIESGMKMSLIEKLKKNLYIKIEYNFT